MARRLALWLLSALQHLALKLGPAPAGGCSIDAIYSLGDSLADTGNLVRLAPPTTAAYFPYGETLKKPTGRFSDGLLVIDYFATALNLPYVPPYLDKSANFEHGVNFAVAGATALDQLFFLENGISFPFPDISLDVQLQWFKDHLKDSVCSSKEECSKKLEKALFFVGEIGGNDYYYALTQGKSLEEVKTYVPLVVSKIVNAAKEVIDVGAIRLIVPGNFPIGCMPSYLTAFSGRDSNFDDRNCLKDLNDFAELHNQYLQKALDDVKKDQPQVSIMYADYYYTYLDMVDRAQDYGLDKSSVLKSCCGIGGRYNFNLKIMCGNPGVPVCPDPTKFISWDGIHLTQEAYKNMANQLLLNIEFLNKWKC